MSDHSRVALVTGAAQGIGKAIALRLARDGLSVGLNDIHSKKGELNAVAQEIKERGGRAAIFLGDVAVQQNVQTMIDGTVQELGGLHVMVANAGIGRPAPFLEESLESFNSVMSINTAGLFLCYQLSARKMIELGHREGRIIGASSIGGKQPLRGLTSYTASKFAVRGLTQCAALDLGSHGITVNAYAPGAIPTTAVRSVLIYCVGLRLAAYVDGLREHTDLDFDKWRAAAPLSRVGQSKDVAALVSFLASKEAGYITGESPLNSCDKSQLTDCVLLGQTVRVIVISAALLLTLSQISIDGGAHMD
ncbi:hypothetical protein HDZ31DRAFT_34857 [Schizophyllum fasciatum]